MKEQLVSIEVARLLKDRGFGDKCYAMYSEKRQELELNYTEDMEACINDVVCTYGKTFTRRDKYILAPTQSLAQKWLRETKDTHFIISPIDEKEKGLCFQFIVLRKENGMLYTYGGEGGIPTYEECLERAFKYALEEIIE